MIKHNIVKTESVDWDYQVTSGSNTATCSGSYKDDYIGWESRCPYLDSPHPDIPALLLQSIKAKREEGQLIKVDLQYSTSDPAKPAPGRDPNKTPEENTVYRYAIEPTASEEPLLTNELFKDLADKEKSALLELMASNKNKEAFTAAADVVTSNEGLKAIAKIRKGVESYLSPGTVWVERFVTKNPDDIWLGIHLTTTDTPRGPCPACGVARNWLYMAGPLNPHDDGICWDAERRWQLSLPGKWDPDFYPPGTPP